MPVRMLSGFNHNIKYKGKTYHIQTEDSGRANPHVITHTFIGGVILDTVRSSYEDIVETPGWQDKLRDRMKAQHLEEIRRLLSGAVDVPEEGTPPDA
jgi:hypothetical protein